MKLSSKNARYAVCTIAMFWIGCSVGATDSGPELNSDIDAQAAVTTATPEGNDFADALEVTLTASEPATIYYTLSGSNPNLDGEETRVDESPVRIEMPEGVTEIRFFSVDSSGNQEQVRAETYLVDTTPPEITLVNDAPIPAGLLATTAIEWQSNETGGFSIERGGDGQRGSGEPLHEGTVESEVSLTFAVDSLDLPLDEPVSFWIHADDWTGRVTGLEVVLEIAAPNHVAWTDAPGDVVVSPEGDRAYVARKFGRELDVVDLDPESDRYLEVLETVDLGIRPWSLAITPDGSRVYASNAVEPGAIAVVSTDSNLLDDTIYGVGIPGRVAFDPDGYRGYFTDYAGALLVLDTDPFSKDYHSVLDRIHLRNDLLTATIAISSDGTRALLNWNGEGVSGASVLDLDETSANFRDLISSPVDTTAGASGGATLSPGGGFGYVATSDPLCGLCTIDLATGIPHASLTQFELLGDEAAGTGLTFGGQKVVDLQWDLALTDDDRYLIAVGPNSSNMKLYSAENLEEILNVEIGDGASAITLTPDGTHALISRIGTERELVVVKLR